MHEIIKLLAQFEKRGWEPLGGTVLHLTGGTFGALISFRL